MFLSRSNTSTVAVLEREREREGYIEIECTLGLTKSAYSLFNLLAALRGDTANTILSISFSDNSNIKDYQKNKIMIKTQ